MDQTKRLQELQNQLMSKAKDAEQNWDKYLAVHGNTMFLANMVKAEVKDMPQRKDYQKSVEVHAKHGRLRAEIKKNVTSFIPNAAFYVCLSFMPDEKRKEIERQLCVKTRIDKPTKKL